MAARCFRGFTLHARQGRKEERADFFWQENQPPPTSLNKLGDMRTGKKADLQKCLERSPLGPWNADEDEVLVDVLIMKRRLTLSAMISPQKRFLILSVELSLNLVSGKRNN